MRKTLQPLILLRNIVFTALIIAIPFAVLYFYAINRPVAFADSYYAALQGKYDRIKQVDVPKVVVIGGSATAFAIDSDLIEKETGLPVVNFGLYAAIGFKPMLDLALPHINAGDIVILLPEPSSQTYSTYAGYEYLLYAMEGRSDMAMTLGWDYTKYFLHFFPEYLKKADKALNSENNNHTIYASSSFNEKGDIIYRRPENIMSLGYSLDNPPEIKSSIITDSFADMVNKFTKKAEKHGASVYMSFPPINSASIFPTSDEDLISFINTLSDKLVAPVCSNISGCIMEPGYFYDSNFHVNDAGSTYFSLLLSNDIKRLQGNVSETLTAFPTPPPLYVTIAIPKDIQGFKCLVSEDSVYITGITSTLIDNKVITIPDTLDDKKVVALQGAIFEDCERLEEIIIQCSSRPEVGTNLLSGLNNPIKIKVPKDLYIDYLTDYFWGYYSENLE